LALAICLTGVSYWARWAQLVAFSLRFLAIAEKDVWICVSLTGSAFEIRNLEILHPAKDHTPRNAHNTNFSTAQPTRINGQRKNQNKAVKTIILCLLSRK